MKAKTLDRLELTRKKFSRDNAQPKENISREFYSICPECGKNSLRHDGSCVICENCSYSKCG